MLLLSHLPNSCLARGLLANLNQQPKTTHTSPRLSSLQIAAHYFETGIKPPVLILVHSFPRRHLHPSLPHRIPRRIKSSGPPYFHKPLQPPGSNLNNLILPLLHPLPGIPPLEGNFHLPLETHCPLADHRY